MKDMGKTPGLNRRGDVFYFRKRIPEDVRKLILSDFVRWKTLALNPGSTFQGWQSIAPRKGEVRSFFERSLGTSDRRRAEIEFYDLSSRLADAYEALRAAFAEQPRVTTDQDLRRLAQKYFSEKELSAEADVAALGGWGDELRQAGQNLIEDLGALNQEDPVIVGRMQREARQLLLASQFESQAGALATLSGYLFRAEQLLLKRQIERYSDNFVALPSDPMFAGFSQPVDIATEQNEERGGVTLQEAYQAYCAYSIGPTTSKKTVRKIDYTWRLMADIFGAQTSVRSLTRSDARKFADIVADLPANWNSKPELAGLDAIKAANRAAQLELEPCHPNTAKGYVNRLSTFFGYLEQEDLIVKNIARRLIKSNSRGKSQKTRKPFTVEELRRIFGPDYRGTAMLHAKARKSSEQGGLSNQAYYWAPLIALFTGMRLSEICQLTKGEFQEIDGVWCIGVKDFLDEDFETDDDENAVTRSMKSDAVVRFIPVVDELVRLGLKKLCEQVDGGFSARIFSHLKPDRDGYVSDTVSRWFARHLDRCGIISRTKVFHSFRHTFRDALRAAQVDREVVLRIGAWSSGNTADRYGAGSPVQLAEKELAKIKYTGLDLSHLCPR